MQCTSAQRFQCTANLKHHVPAADLHQIRLRMTPAHCVRFKSMWCGSVHRWIWPAGSADELVMDHGLAFSCDVSSLQGTASGRSSHQAETSFDCREGYIFYTPNVQTIDLPARSIYKITQAVHA